MLILLAAALSTPTPLPLDRSGVHAVPARCKQAADKAAANGRMGFRKLDEMPPAQAIRAVWRFDERGCPVLVVVRPTVGDDGR